MGQLERWSRCSCNTVALSTKPGFRFQGVKQGEWGMGNGGIQGGLVLSSGKKLFLRFFIPDFIPNFLICFAILSPFTRTRQPLRLFPFFFFFPVSKVVWENFHFCVLLKKRNFSRNDKDYIDCYH